MSGRTGHSQGPSEEFKDCLRVATVASTFLECFKVAGNGFLDQTLLLIYLSLTYVSTFWKISEDKGKEGKEIKIAFIELLQRVQSHSSYNA